MPLKSLLKTAGVVALTVGATMLASTASYGAPAAQDDASDAGGAAPSTQQTTTVRYGPYTIPAGGHLPNSIASDVPKPCTDCFITGIQPDLVYADGSNANVDTGPMLHHMVLMDASASDVTCTAWPGQRIFASGNERVGSTFPSGYGMAVDGSDRWDLLYELMNHAQQDKTVYISVTYTHEPASGSSLRDVTPIWMDADGVCSDSAWDAPAGVSERSARWTSSVSGDLVAMGGHLHRGGVAVWTDNLTTGERLCTSEAEQGGSAEFIDPHGVTYISDMSTCSGDALATIETGDVLEITARYDTEEATGGVMGIMMGWIAEN